MGWIQLVSDDSRIRYRFTSEGYVELQIVLGSDQDIIDTYQFGKEDSTELRFIHDRSRAAFNGWIDNFASARCLFASLSKMSIEATLFARQNTSSNPLAAVEAEHMALAICKGAASLHARILKMNERWVKKFA